MVVLILILGVFITFLYFSPISYGFVGKANIIMKGRQWRSSWNVVDIE